MTLPVDLAAAVQRRDVPVAFLIRFDFVSQVKRVWAGGFGKLRTVGGLEWDSVGEAVSISGIGGALSGTAPAGTVTASGVSPTLLPIAIGEEAEFRQRPVAFFFQVFNPDLTQLGPPLPLGLRIMTTMSITRTADTRSITINHESPYVGRNNPANGWYSDRDQQRRFPGDRFCERVPYLVAKTEKWPDY